jgi:hypothetical protein
VDICKHTIKLLCKLALLGNKSGRTWSIKQRNLPSFFYDPGWEGCSWDYYWGPNHIRIFLDSLYMFTLMFFFVNMWPTLATMPGQLGICVKSFLSVQRTGIFTSLIKKEHMNFLKSAKLFFQKKLLYMNSQNISTIYFIYKQSMWTS